MSKKTDLWARSTRRFFSWWGRTLLSLVPSRIRQGLRPQPPTLVLDLSNNDLRLSLFSRRSHRDLGRFPITARDRTQLRIALSEALDRVRLGRTRIALRLPAEKAVRRVLTLPSSVEADLSQAMTFQIDRMTPFAPDQVYYDFRVIDRDTNPGDISVELVAVPRRCVDQAVTTVKGCGLEPRIVDVADQGFAARPCRNLLSAGWHRRSGSLWSPLNRVLVATLALLAVTAAVLPLAKNVALAEKLQGDLARVRAASEQILKLRDQVDLAERRAGFILGERGMLPSRVTVIETLTRVLPDDSWLYQLEISGHDVGVRGYGRDAAGLVPKLAGEPAFHRPRFRAPVVKDMATGLDRFDIAFGLKP